MICNLVRFGRRQLHTIVSREIIKPSSLTPSHLKTYNLSLLDQITPGTFIPIVTFYPNTGSSHDKALDLKNSLSQTLTKYYPFAGTHAKVAPSYVDCNDNGAEFLEASIDSTLSDFLQNSQHKDLDQFFPHGLVNFDSNRGEDDLQSDDQVTPLEVQVNHFECGGVAVAVSLSHKVADGSSFAHFINDWAKMTRFCSREQKHEYFSIDPQFITFPYMKLNNTRYTLERSDDCVLTRSFMFPNSKIHELKLKVKAITAESRQPITNPTRVEVLTWLLYKCAVAAATKNNSGPFKPTGVGQLANLRGKMMEQLPEKSIGNFFIPLEILTKKESEMNPESFVSELKKQKMQFKALRNIETLFGIFLDNNLEEQLRKSDGAYICSSLCGYPVYDIDFGWGKPIKVTHAGNLRKNTFILIDAPNKDGIEALVCLGKHDMAIFQTDPELLAFG
ncbi:hypothetical protein L2E82_11077 [Cichorium intybus]|uniref:Uncharacterized protein n=1 Tax=Cichorium intybus TaxID=13427 RepID=A0ACB9GD12_CICIN|nr:hypothetical protein L2E82_11077 [Cichorium intybus]